MNLQERLLARFLRYAAVTTQSRAGSKTIPSTPGQWELARMLAGDMEELGVLDVSVEKSCRTTLKLIELITNG